MRAGQLRHRVTIEQLVAASPTQNAGGEIDDDVAHQLSRPVPRDVSAARDLEHLEP